MHSGRVSLPRHCPCSPSPVRPKGARAMGSRGGWAERIPYARSAPMYLIHAVALVGPFLVRFSWNYVWMAVALYVARMFSLRRLPPLLRPPHATRPAASSSSSWPSSASTCAQKGALWWAANHRHHHRYSDQPEDLHSPLQRRASGGATSAGSSPSDYDDDRLRRDPRLRPATPSCAG